MTARYVARLDELADAIAEATRAREALLARAREVRSRDDVVPNKDLVS